MNPATSRDYIFATLKKILIDYENSSNYISRRNTHFMTVNNCSTLVYFEIGLGLLVEKLVNVTSRYRHTRLYTNNVIRSICLNMGKIHLI